MRYLILLLFCGSAFAQTECKSGLITLYDSAGIAQSPQYSQPYTAIVAAIELSKKTGKATIKTADIVCTTKSSSSSSSPSSNLATVSWSTPASRVNGVSLPASEIAFFDIRQMKDGWIVAIDKASRGQTQKAIVYKGGDVEIATVDTKGVYSKFVTIPK